MKKDEEKDLQALLESPGVKRIKEALSTPEGEKLHYETFAKLLLGTGVFTEAEIKDRWRRLKIDSGLIDA